MLAESSDLYVERDQIVRDLERLPLAANDGAASFFIDDRPLSDQLRVDAEDSDDEQDDDEDDCDDDEYDGGDVVDSVSSMRRSRTKTNGLYAGGRLPKLQLCAKVSNSSTDTRDR